jgi:branched-chain amino acid transport system substrate-binding protein
VFHTRTTAGSLAVVLALGVAACGSSDESSTSTGGGSASGTVDVYSSLPLQGASKTQTAPMVQGMRLALDQAHGKAGNVTVKYTSLDDSTAQAGAWDPQQTASNARKAAQDKKAVAYLGEFNSNASAISIPLLNQVGLAQISPANTASGLTTSDPGTVKGEPQKYYPTGERTFARIVPRDTIQGAALIGQVKSDGCTKVAVANDKELYGAGLATVLGIKAKALGVEIVSNTPIQKDAANFRSYAQKIKGEGADCFIFSGTTPNAAIQINKDVGAALPSAKLYGADGICSSSFTNPSQRGIPAALGARFKCTVPTLNLTAYPGGREFLAAYKAKYKTASPDPYAIYGYEAMKLVLDTIKAAGPDGTTKDGFLAQLFKTKDRHSVLGTYSIDANGDTTQTDYGLYKVGSDGNPTYVATLKAQGGA